MDIKIGTDDYSPPTIGDRTAFTSQVIVDNEGLKRLPDAAERVLPLGHVALCFDDNVKDLGDVAADVMRRAGYSVECSALGALGTLREDVRLMISIGGGSAANAVKLEAGKRGAEWIHLMTCASTDSALYPYAELFENGRRKVVPCTPPTAVVIDEVALKSSPRRCTAAGYGTLFSKLLVLFCLRADAMCDGEPHPAQEALESCLCPYFDEPSVEHPAVRTATALVKVGLIAQCLPADFLQREEYNAAIVLSAFRKRERLIGEDAMLASLALAAIYLRARLPQRRKMRAATVCRARIPQGVGGAAGRDDRRSPRPCARFSAAVRRRRVLAGRICHPRHADRADVAVRRDAR